MSGGRVLADPGLVLDVPDAIVPKLDCSGRPMNYGAPAYPRVERRDRPDPGGRAGRC